MRGVALLCSVVKEMDGRLGITRDTNGSRGARSDDDDDKFGLRATRTLLR